MSILLKLPKDVIRYMIHNHFHPVDALKCLRLSKYINNILDRGLIIDRVLKNRSEDSFQRQLEKLHLCPFYQINLGNEKALKNHLRKHELAKKNGKELNATGKKFKKSKCHNCNCSVSNLTAHSCLTYDRSCVGKGISTFYVWMDVLCEQERWYRDDPNLDIHKCYGICKICKTRVSLGYEYDEKEKDHVEGCAKHFHECPERQKMIEIYTLKGERTDEEWETFLEFLKNNPGENRRLGEIRDNFEREYLRWKEECYIPNLQPSGFVQKPYNIYE